MNETNSDVYQGMSPERLWMYTAMSGLTESSDLDAIAQAIPLLQARTILDLGSGAGRAIQYLGDNRFAGHITAVERSPTFCKHLQQHFPSATIIQGDMLTVEIPSDQYDVALHLWAGYVEFSREEQQRLLKKIHAALKNGGHYIIDIYTWSFLDGGKNVRNRIAEGTLKGYLPTDKEIENDAKSAGFSHVEVITIYPKPLKPRNIYFLKK